MWQRQLSKLTSKCFKGTITRLTHFFVHWVLFDWLLFLWCRLCLGAWGPWRSEAQDHWTIWTARSYTTAAVASLGSGTRGHETTWNFLSHIKWREIIHWTTFVFSRLNYRSCSRRIQVCLERQPHEVPVRLYAALKLTKKISPVRDWRSTPSEWLSCTRDLDLDLGSSCITHRSLFTTYQRLCSLGIYGAL